MPVLGCGAEMAKLMDVSDMDVATIEDVIAERLALGVSQPVAQRQAVDEALAQLAEERSMVMKAVMEQLGFDPTAKATYVTTDEISKMQRDAWSAVIKTPKYAQLSGDVKAAEDASAARWSTVRAKALEILKANPAYSQLAGKYDDRTLQNLATIFMEQANEQVPASRPSVGDANKALQDYTESYFKDVAKIPEPRAFAENANQKRGYYESQKFKNWFKDSKAVDAKGNPLVAFHVTTKDFVEFDTEAGASKGQKSSAAYSGQLGAWFTAPSLYDGNYDPGNAEVAVDGFIRDEGESFKDGAITMAVHLSIQNPMEYSDFESMLEDRDSFDSIAAFKADLVKQGYDGIVVRNSDTDGGVDRDDWVAFKPAQIKSAYGNNGNFDPADNRIAFSNKPQTETPEFKRWFEGSQVVDQDGKPLVVYHGTVVRPDTENVKGMGDIMAFDRMFTTKFRSPSLDTVGSWFSTNPGDGGAEMYTGGGTGAAIYPVYLSIKNPHVTTFYMMARRARLLANGKDDDRRIGTAEVDAYRKWLRSMDKDGIKIEGSGREGSTEFDNQTAWIALEPEQIKSAIGNSGAFDPENPSIIAANKARPAPLADETRTDAFRRVMQDKYLHVEKIQEFLLEKGGVVGEQQNVYRAEERMHGRAQEKLIDFGRNMLEPLLKKAANYGIDINELAVYAYAKHAQERNAHIDTINPLMQGAGSGMDDATAQNVIQMVQLAGDQAKFDDLHSDLMRMTEATRQEYLKSGLISQQDYDDWTQTYGSYVPLKGFENVDPEGKPKPGAGSGLSIKGKETLRAMGRRSRAGDIIENIVAEHERAVVRGERNLVAKTFLNMVQTNPEPDLWEVQPRKLQRSFDKKRNLVVYNQALDTADSIGAKVAGQQIYIKVKDPLLLRALTNEGLDKKGALHGTVVEYLGMYTNLLRNTLTRYNPIFGFVNSVKDAPMGALMTYDKLGAEGAKLYAKYYPAAILASGRHEANRSDMSHDMDRWLKEMRLAGGTTSGVFMRDVADIRSDLRHVMLMAGGATPTNLREKLIVKGKTPLKVAQATGKVLEWWGATSEDAARLAAYRAAREMGKSPAEAASIAKNLTTNFNRSGEWGSSINGLYLFFNAGVQGTARLAQALQNPKVRYALAAGVAASMAIAFANVDIGGEDDDGVPYWDKIPDYEKERNLIIMIPPGMEMMGTETVGKKGQYIKIPVQYGLNIFSTFGYQLADMARNVKDPARGVTPYKAAINMVSVVTGSINPFGGSLDPTDPVQVGMALLPTVGDTALQQMGGYNAFGRPVGPAKFDKDQPDSETFSPSQAGSFSQRAARWMNSVTGGNEGRSGFIDVMPGTLDNAARNTAGGLGAFVAAMVNLPQKYWNAPDTVTARDVPLMRNFYSELDSANDVSRFYDNRAKAMVEGKAAEREEKLGVEREYTPEETALQSLAEMSKQYTADMTEVRKEEIEIALDDKLSEGEKLTARRRLAIERGRIARDFNSQFVKDMEEVKRSK